MPNMYERHLGVPMRGVWLESTSDAGGVIITVQWWPQFERRDRRGLRVSLIETRLYNILNTNLSSLIATME